jgi:hypothetical protein
VISKSEWHCAWAVAGIDTMTLPYCRALQYYQVPRLWLVGYDESRQPLAPKQVSEGLCEGHSLNCFAMTGSACFTSQLSPCHHWQLGLSLALLHTANLCSLCIDWHKLAPVQILEDVSEEHARKTITVDSHPHLPISAASIHPCRHAEVMKRLVDNLIASGHEFSVNQ